MPWWADFIGYVTVFSGLMHTMRNIFDISRHELAYAAVASGLTALLWGLVKRRYLQLRGEATQREKADK